MALGMDLVVKVAQTHQLFCVVQLSFWPVPRVERKTPPMWLPKAAM